MPVRLESDGWNFVKALSHLFNWSDLVLGIESRDDRIFFSQPIVSIGAPSNI